MLVMAAAVATLVLPATAVADKRIEAAPSLRYTTPEVTMDQGEPLTFRNSDLAGHDVTSVDNGPNGKPWFSTPIIGTGEEAFVEGSQFLTGGNYPFICSVHPQMKGTLHVTGNGSAKERPAPGASASNDTVAPTVGLSILSRRTRAVRSKRALRVRVRLDEAGRVALRAIARPKPGGPLIVLARGRVSFPAAGLRRVDLQLTRAGRAALRHRRRLVVVVRGVATDAAGNKAQESSGRTLPK